MQRNTLPPIAYAFLGLVFGYLLPLAGMTAEDYMHGIYITPALSDFHHHIPPIAFGLLCMVTGYAFGDNLRKKSLAESKLKQSNKILERDNENFKKINNSMALGIYTRTVAGQFISANQRFLDLFEYGSVEELQSINANTFYINQQDKNRFEDRLKKEGHVHNMAVNLKTQRGAIRPTLVTAEKTQDVIIGFIADVHLDKTTMVMTECMVCRKYRDGSQEHGQWVSPANYFQKHKTEIKDPGKDYMVSHGICSSCLKDHYDFSSTHPNK